MKNILDLGNKMEGCKKYNTARADMLRMRHEIRTEYKEALMQIRFFGLLRYDREGMAS